MPAGLPGTELSDGIVGKAGQFMAAIMETAGLYGQSQILENFGDLIHTSGAFVYAWCLIGAVFSLALWGNYVQAMWFLIGPALFFWVLDQRIDVVSTAYQNGQRLEMLSEQQIEFLKKNGNAARYQNGARVSWVFARFDSLVSSITQGLVAHITNQDDYQDLRFIARERVMKSLLRARGGETEFIQLLSLSLLGDCAKAIDLSKQIASPRLTKATAGTVDFREKELKLAKRAPLLEKSVQFPASLEPYVESLHDPGFTFPERIRCAEIWEYTRLASLRMAETLLAGPTSDFKEQFSPYFFEDGSRNPDGSLKTKEDMEREFWENVYEEVISKLTPKTGDPALDQQAKAFEIFAAFYLRNSVTHTPHARLTSAFAGREVWNRHLYTHEYGNTAYGLASAERLKTVAFAGSIPYMQGVLLYLLTIAFPFFAIFLLFPSRISAFFIWMSLWVWVKSWDVGFAVVSVLRDLLWEMMPNAGGYRIVQNFSEVRWDDPASFLNIMYLTDPLSMMATYWQLIALITVSVPMITAHLCLGATGLYSALEMSFTDWPTRVLNENSNSQWRKFATKVDTWLSQNTQLGRLYGSQEHAANPGTTEDGVMRWASGSGAAARHGKEMGNHHRVADVFDDNTMRAQQALTMYTGRTMPYQQIHSSKEKVNAIVNRAKEPYNVDWAWQSGNADWPFKTSEKFNDMSPGIGEGSFLAGSHGVDGADMDGGD